MEHNYGDGEQGSSSRAERGKKDPAKRDELKWAFGKGGGRTVASTRPSARPAAPHAKPQRRAETRIPRMRLAMSMRHEMYMAT
jgi:hypothetical protein